jgi:hypothetical protein
VSWFAVGRECRGALLERRAGCQISRSVGSTPRPCEYGDANHTRHIIRKFLRHEPVPAGPIDHSEGYSAFGLCLVEVSLETVFDGLPVNVGEERFDVFGSFSGLIIEQERMFPYVHHQHRLESGHVADLM